MVGMFACLCLASKKPFKRAFFVPARRDLLTSCATRAEGRRVTHSSNGMVLSPLLDEYDDARDNQDMHLLLARDTRLQGPGIHTPQISRMHTRGGAFVRGGAGVQIWIRRRPPTTPGSGLDPTEDGAGGDGVHARARQRPRDVGLPSKSTGDILDGARVSLGNLWVCPTVAVNRGGHCRSVGGCLGNAQ